MSPEATPSEIDEYFLSVAIEQAKVGLHEGGIPIGCVLVMDEDVIAGGRNRRVQLGDPILHAEMDALRQAGRRTASEYRRMSLYSTLSPCHMCSGAVLLYGIPRVVIGESKTFKGPESLLQEHGVQLSAMNSQACVDLMATFIEENPSLWNEDIGI